VLPKKIIFSALISVIIGSIGSMISFDYDNYVQYAERVDESFERFSIEPVFPLFVLAGNAIGISSDAVVQAFIITGAFLIVLATTSLSNNSGYFSYSRGLAALITTSPFIMFLVIVPRQALASGLILLAVSRLRGMGRLGDWKTLVIIALAIMTHGLTAIFGALIMIAGHVNKKIFVGYIFFLALILLLYQVVFEDNILFKFITTYDHYIQNFRGTGLWRISFFIVVACLYFVFPLKQSGGSFSQTPLRNMTVAFLFTSFTVFVYFFISDDAIRFTYLLGVIMMTEFLSRIRFTQGKITPTGISVAQFLKNPR